MNKLKIVIKHEYLTIVKQPSFWIIMLAIPLMIALVLGLSYVGNKSSEDRIKSLANNIKNVAIVDKSGLINQSVLASGGLSASPSSSENMLKEEVREGKKQALIVYPADITKDRKYSIYLSSTDFTMMGTVTTVADSLLKTSLFLPLGSADVIALAQNGAQTNVVTYKNGVETAGVNEYVVPGLFVVLFYIIFAFSVGYMLTSVSEEKENRSMEMVLTYVASKNLIVGKLLAVILVTLTQVVFFALLAAVAYLVMQSMGNQIALPAGIELQKLVFNPVTILFAASFLVVGFLMFAGFMTATAAITPSTKEANSYSAVFYIGAFIPFYFVTMILTDPENPITKFITFFPLTSPVVTLLRNTVGNMSLLEASLALATMTVFMIVSIWLAIRAFSRGALEYSGIVNLKSLFK